MEQSSQEVYWNSKGIWYLYLFQEGVPRAGYFSTFTPFACYVLLEEGTFVVLK